MRQTFHHSNIHNIEAEYLSLQNKVVVFAKNKFSSEDFLSNSIAIFAHAAILFFLLVNFTKEQAAPVLSFTVTMMDISSSSKNVVATSASSSSQLSAKEAAAVKENGLTKTEQKPVDKNVDQVKHSGNKSSQSYDSVEQVAVVANSKASYDASYLNNPAPRYPAISRTMQEQGTVLLNVVVDENGLAKSVALNKSSGFSRLDDAAISTVKKWKFVPAQNGQATMTSTIQVPIKFILEQ